eukprot:COSAG01_NODE_3335_length_6237_cov_5.928315_3_plen_99_part_00
MGGRGRQAGGQAGITRVPDPAAKQPGEHHIQRVVQLRGDDHPQPRRVGCHGRPPQPCADTLREQLRRARNDDDDDDDDERNSNGGSELHREEGRRNIS